MIANAIAILVSDARKRMLHHRLPSDLAKSLIKLGSEETWIIAELDGR
jgi:hypothetical protein